MIYDTLFKKEVRERVVPDPESEFGQLFKQDAVTTKQAMTVPVIAAVVNLIAGTVSALPVKLYKVDENGRTEVSDYRVGMLNDDCGDLMSPMEMKYSLARDYILNGSGYYFCEWTGNKVSMLSYLKPQAVSYSKIGMNIYKEFFYMCDGVKIEPYRMGRVLRNTENGAAGRGIVQEQGDYVQMLINIQNLLSRTSKQGGKLILQPENRMDQGALNSLKTAWQNLYGSNDGESMMIMNSTIGIKQLEAQVKAEISSVEELSSDKIMAALGVPSKILFGGASEYDYSLFKNNALLPVIRTFEKSFNRFLLLERERGKYEFVIDTDQLTTESLAQRMEGYSKAMANSVMSINDVRRKEDLPTMDKDYYHLSLASVLWDPETGEIYNTNMSTKTNINDTPQPVPVEEEEVKADDGNQKEPG